MGREKRNFINAEYPSVSATGSPGDVSHYTQMIWQDTAEVGCGKANSSGYEILVCDYSPRGNVNGTAVYGQERPKVVEAKSTNQFKTLTNSFAKIPKRNIIINSAFNRPVSCYESVRFSLEDCEGWSGKSPFLQDAIVHEKAETNSEYLEQSTARKNRRIIMLDILRNRAQYPEIEGSRD